MGNRECNLTLKDATGTPTEDTVRHCVQLYFLLYLLSLVIDDGIFRVHTFGLSPKLGRKIINI